MSKNLLKTGFDVNHHKYKYKYRMKPAWQLST